MELATVLSTVGSFAFTIVAFIIALSIIVFIHEYGHYIVGRWTGIKADVFSVGFGKPLWQRTDKHGTVWQVAALPLGGYVKFRGDANAASVGTEDGGLANLSHDELRETMHGAPVWARALTVLAGPVFNFLLSIAIFASLFTYMGVPTEETRIDEVFELPFGEQELLPGDIVQAIEGRPIPTQEVFGEVIGDLAPSPELTYTVVRDGRTLDVPGPWLSPTRAVAVDPNLAAHEAGILEGDVIVSVDGDPVFDVTDLQERIGTSGGEPVTLEVWRDGEILIKEMTPTKRDVPVGNSDFETRYLIGISLGLPFTRATETPGPFEAVSLGAQRTFGAIVQSISAIGHIVAGEISTCNLNGPVGIAKVTGQAASLGLFAFLGTVALISTAVGFLNLLPIPVLDGGHLVFFAWEALTGNPPNERVLNYLMIGGLTIMGALMVFALSNDFLC